MAFECDVRSIVSNECRDLLATNVDGTYSRFICDWAFLVTYLRTAQPALNNVYNNTSEQMKANMAHVV
eukprot:scaffold107675_cov21-Prasinocladus_malaysianus.AAC.1